MVISVRAVRLGCDERGGREREREREREGGREGETDRGREGGQRETRGSDCAAIFQGRCNVAQTKD
jgi:hypothetical protein